MLLLYDYIIISSFISSCTFGSGEFRSNSCCWLLLLLLSFVASSQERAVVLGKNLTLEVACCYTLERRCGIASAQQSKNILSHFYCCTGVIACMKRRLDIPPASSVCLLRWRPLLFLQYSILFILSHIINCWRLLPYSLLANSFNNEGCIGVRDDASLCAVAETVAQT